MGLFRAGFRAMARIVGRSLAAGRSRLDAFDAFAAVALAVAGVAGVAACGPSFQLIYECDVHFEHCYALEQTDVSVEVRSACWRQWLSTYDYGQPRDRVEYAARHAGWTAQAFSAPDASAPVTVAAAASTAASPVPTNAFLPPPSVASALSTATATAAFSAKLPDLKAPGRVCGDGCEDHWRSCRAHCADAACAACDRAYRACMPACFR